MHLLRGQCFSTVMTAVPARLSLPPADWFLRKGSFSVCLLSSSLTPLPSWKGETGLAEGDVLPSEVLESAIRSCEAICSTEFYGFVSLG